jgi:hypothetical protein
MRMSLKLACATALMAMAAPAFAGHFLFSITGSGYSASGMLTTDDLSGEPNDYPCAGCATGPGYLVTGMTGTINGDAITGVAPLGALAGNNNKLYTTAPYLDWGDLGIQTATHIYNVFEAKYYTGQSGWFIVANDTPLFSSPVTFSLSAAPAPEPASWVLLVGGFGLVGGALRTRRPALAAAI